MERTNNYLIQARQAKDLFLGYDQQALIRKFGLEHDEAYLYLTMFHEDYRIHRTTGDMQRHFGGTWVDANSHGEVMSILDLLCGSRNDRRLSGRWKNMSAFGLQFHQSLLEREKNTWAERFQNDQAGFRQACLALGGTPLPIGDIAYSIEVFDGLPIALQLWLGDDEFPPNLRYLWDENAAQYIRYETMYYALDVLLNRIEALMAKGS